MTTNTEHRPTADIEDLKESLYDFACMRLAFHESGNASDGELLLTRAAELHAKASAVVDKICVATRWYAGVGDDLVFIGAFFEVTEAVDKAVKPPMRLKQDRIQTIVASMGVLDGLRRKFEEAQRSLHKRRARGDYIKYAQELSARCAEATRLCHALEAYDERDADLQTIKACQDTIGTGDVYSTL